MKLLMMTEDLDSPLIFDWNTPFAESGLGQNVAALFTEKLFFPFSNKSYRICVTNENGAKLYLDNTHKSPIVVIFSRDLSRFVLIMIIHQSEITTVSSSSYSMVPVQRRLY